MKKIFENRVYKIFEIRFKSGRSEKYFRESDYTACLKNSADEVVSASEITVGEKERKTLTGSEIKLFLSNTEKRKKGLISKKWLKNRGWTDAAIKKFLPEPDDYDTNPHAPRSEGKKIKLYYKFRVEEIEDTEEFRKWKKERAEKERKKLFGDKYPVEWMKRGEAKKILERYSLTAPLLNYLFRLNHSEATEKIRTHPTAKFFEEKDEDGYKYAVFITDRNFYCEAVRKTGRSEILIKKYLRALRDTGIIKEIGAYGIHGTVYADGCYKRGRKVPLLTEKEFRQALLKLHIRR
ncbi:MAG: hypothetical protein GY795_11555 [Desulfobacterales bacterium]|nr:hypothetical protein [Desulfobacterales bacterium]